MTETKIPLVSVVMPCLNEEEALASCIEKIKNVFEKQNIAGEIIVADNGSTDRSVDIAESMGVCVVHQPMRGYGNTYLKGFAETHGKYIVMGDADDTYDFNLIPQFVEKLDKEGYDFVTGSRYLSGDYTGMNRLHRWLGNPMLTTLLNTFFGSKYSDVYCGFRAFTRQAYDLIKPVSSGMEFNLELAINAHLAHLRITEIPIVLGQRKGKSKLNTFEDGWRSLRMMLLYCPNMVFLAPGGTLFAIGMILHLAMIFHLFAFQQRAFSDACGIAATILSVVGFQILSLGLHAKTYSWGCRFDKDNRVLEKFYGTFKLESGLAIGALLLLSGLTICFVYVRSYLHSDLFALSRPDLAQFGATLIIIGTNTLFSSLFISAMSVTKQENP